MSATRPQRTTPPATVPTGGVEFWLAVAWLVVLAVIFFSHRDADVGRLPQLLSRFASEFRGLKLSALGANFCGGFIAVLVVLSWLGVGEGLRRILKLPDLDEGLAGRARSCAWGAGITSLISFALGRIWMYEWPVAAGLLLIGAALGVDAIRRRSKGSSPQDSTTFSRFASVLLFLPLSLAAVASLAPPTAKDALLYHISLPKAFLAAGAITDVPGNIAQYYPLGAEMNGLWGMLTGRLIGLHTGEAAFGAIQFAYLALLIAFMCGVARRYGISNDAAKLAAASFACVPTVYASASSGYNDMALALYLLLAVDAAARWWKTPERALAVEIGLALAFALTVKLLAIFLIAPLIVLFLLRARHAEQEFSASSATRNKVLLSAGTALLIAVVVASPWYLSTWARTGSPVFPFYMNVFHGSAPGWDQQRSLLDQTLNVRYGGYPKSALDYAAVPFRLSLTAQPDWPKDFDGVLGIAFLFGVPLLLLAWRRLRTEAKIAAALAGSYFLVWTFSSEQLRYLLPILPALAIAIVAAATALNGRMRWLVAAAAVPGMIVILAWLLQQDPLVVVVGSESRQHYLERSLSYFPMYEAVNSQLPPDARVWLINMRRDTYYLERPYFADFRFEDYTLVQMVRASGNLEQLRDHVRAAGITHVLVRTDLLLNHATSPVVDDKAPRAENERKLNLLRSFLTDGKVLRRQGDYVLFSVD
ncbi:MAG: hypothetical protein ACE14M_12980 [Terriglobales bacterium]